MSSLKPKIVMLRPESDTERFLRVRYSAVGVLRYASRNPETMSAVGRILFNGQS